jgi:DNA invertase Pin-like site-specific DNA recombinase
MIESYEKCHEVAKGIYGEDCQFFHFTDFGQYDSNDTDRPSFHRLMEALRNGDFDVLMCYTLNTITTNEQQLIALYKEVRSRGMDFMTAGKGLETMKIMDYYIEKNNL